MTSFAKKLAFTLSLLLIAFAFTAPPAEAHKKSYKHTHHVAKKKKGKADAETIMIVKRAQQHLAHLGYYVGKIDGQMGPATKAAIKHFQRDKSLKASGALDNKTRLALENADNIILPRKESGMQPPATNPVDMQVGQDFEASLKGGSKVVSSRYASLDVAETGQGADKRYAVNLNGQPLLLAEGQPSIVGVSTTYDLGDEDAVIFTTFSPNEEGCTYRNRVLAMKAGEQKLLDINNCTRNYQAFVEKGSLYIVFPEKDDNRPVGATWRLEGMTLNKL